MIGDIYDTLLEEAGWSFMREQLGIFGNRSDEYIMLAHIKCPNGVQLEANGTSEPSVMHFQSYICQRCSASPPPGLFGSYKLYAWGTGQEDL